MNNRPFKTSWFKFERKAVEYLLKNDDVQLALYCRLASRAFSTYKEEYYYFGLQLLWLPAGIVLFRLKNIASDSGMSNHQLIQAFKNLFDAKLLNNYYIDCEIDEMPFDVEEECDVNDTQFDACQIARFGKGFIKAPTDIAQLSPIRLRLIIYVLSRTRFRSTATPLISKGRRYLVEKGCFVSSFQEIADELGFDRFKVRRAAQALYNMGFFVQIPSRKSDLWRVTTSQPPTDKNKTPPLQSKDIF